MTEHRRAERLACELPSRLLARGEEFPALVLDVSRTGLKLRMPGRLLGVHRLSCITQVAESVERLLGAGFLGWLGYEALGPLISKRLGVVRVGRRDWESADIDLGCVLLDPLTDVEATMLGLRPADLGPAPGQAPRAPSRLPRGGPSLPAPARTVELAGPRATRRPLRGRPEHLRPDGLTLRVAAPELAGLPQHSVTALAMALGEAYGTAVRLELKESGAALWSGGARLQDVEIVEGDGGGARLGLSFERPLRPPEREALGVR